MLNFAFFIAVGEAGDRLDRTIFGDFFAGEIELFAADPINGARGLEGLRGKHGGVRADKADLCFRAVLFDGFGDFGVVLQ